MMSHDSCGSVKNSKTTAKLFKFLRVVMERGNIVKYLTACRTENDSDEATAEVFSEIMLSPDSPCLVFLYLCLI